MRKDISNKLMILESDKKKWWNSAVWGKKVMSEESGVTTPKRREVEVSTLIPASFGTK